MTELFFTSDLANNLDATFELSPGFFIDFLDASTFAFDLDVNFFVTFALATAFDLIFDFGLTLDFTAMTHILSFL